MSLCEQSSPRECPRPTEATKDTSCRCYLRGPDGVRRLSPSGTWDTWKYSRNARSGKLSRVDACPRGHHAAVLCLLEQREPALIGMRVEEARQRPGAQPLGG